MDKTGRMPNMIHVGTYSAVTQYLKAIQKAGTDATEPVAKALHEMPVQDVFAKNGKVLPNGRMVYDMYLFQVKKPGESKSEWDMYTQLAKIPGDTAYMKAADSGCQVTQ
jgi:branched-chain amino acid transport system substrate-binding protein